MRPTKIDFDHKGIGAVIRSGRMIVPPHQRSYAWEDDHVEDLFHDLSQSIGNDDPDYFLGTIVLTLGQSGTPEISDGQQRMVTTSILLAAIRNKFNALNRSQRAQQIQTDYLSQLAENTDDIVPKIRLNTDDHHFYLNHILEDPNSLETIDRNNIKHSNRRLMSAAKKAKEHIENVTSHYNDEGKAKELLKWMNFIQDNATVVVVTVPSVFDAYRMFETLNDRGLKASQADLLKSYLFSRAQTRIEEAQSKWSSLSGMVEAVGDDSELVTYIRHQWITEKGPTKERELADQIRSDVTGETKALQFLDRLERNSSDYVATFNAGHDKWNSYSARTREYIRIINEDIRVEQIRPLIFAAARHLEPLEAEKAFRLFINWSVRFLVVGGRGGLLDRQYSLRAHDVGTERITKADELVQAMKDVVPTDAAFEESFRTARVSKTWLARYFLRSLDLQLAGEKDPELLVNANKDTVNLEHILPKTPSPDWDIDEDMAHACQNRLGNMALLRARMNVAIGNGGFSEKRQAYQKSNITITKQVAEYQSWSLDEINDRQAKMAKVAIKAWPVILT